MKNSTVFLILGIIVLSVGIAWVISGGPAGLAANTAPRAATPTPTFVVVVPETTAGIPVTTIPPVPAAITIQTTATAKVTRVSSAVSGDEVRDHFLEIAFNPSNRLERLNYTAGKSRVIISAISAGDEDIAIIEKTIRDFNEASSTVKLSENVKDSNSGDILVKFLTEDGLRAIDISGAPGSGTFSEVLTRGEIYQGDVLAAKIMRGTIYINANLRGGARNHVLVRSLMYEMGMTGETVDYPDSIFSAMENTNVDFAPVDKKAIAMLYEPGFSNGMTAEDLRKVIYIP